MNYRILIPLLLSFSVFSISIYQVDLDLPLSARSEDSSTQQPDATARAYPDDDVAQLRRQIQDVQQALLQQRQAPKSQVSTIPSISVHSTPVPKRNEPDVLRVQPNELAARLMPYEAPQAEELFDRIYHGQTVTWTAQYLSLARDTTTVCDALFQDDRGQTFWARFDSTHLPRLKQLQPGLRLKVSGTLDQWYGTTLYLRECTL